MLEGHIHPSAKWKINRGYYYWFLLLSESLSFSLTSNAWNLDIIFDYHLSFFPLKLKHKNKSCFLWRMFCMLSLPHFLIAAPTLFMWESISTTHQCHQKERPSPPVSLFLTPRQSPEVTEWNGLPLSVRASPSVTTYKSQLNLHKSSFESPLKCLCQDKIVSCQFNYLTAFKCFLCLINKLD